MPCITPINIRQTSGDDVGKYRPVPCGKCPYCKRSRINGWAIRLLAEERICTKSLFVTLTYDGQNVPLTPSGLMSLSVRDTQLFFKRLRKIHLRRHPNDRERIRYYLAGEYGGKTSRPHYHAIIFGAYSEDIQTAWGQGHVDYGSVTDGSTRYTAKYIDKPKRIPLFAGDDRVPEFSTMSKNLGISYITPETTKYHIDGQRFYVVHPGGSTSPLPRYYRDKIFNEEDRAQHAYDSMKKYGEELGRNITEYMRLNNVNESTAHREFLALRHQHAKLLQTNPHTFKQDKL